MRVLLVGLPRSGTTWISNVFAAAPGVWYVHEPDSPEMSPFAQVGTRDVGSLPELRPGDRCPSFELLWDLAFGAGWPAGPLGQVAERISFDPHVPRRLRIASQVMAARIAVRRPAQGNHQLVKTVRSYLSTEWIADRCGARVVVVWRNPLNTISSWRRLRWGGCTLQQTESVQRLAGTAAWPPPPVDDAIATAAWGVCANLALLLEMAQRNPSWIVLEHEAVCRDADAQLHEAFDALGLEWSPAVEAALTACDRPGSGWEITRRRAKEADVWARRLSPREREVAIATVERFAAVSDPYGAFSRALAGPVPPVHAALR